MLDHNQVPIRVYNPRRLRAWSLEAERIAVGRPGDYKPSMALLPDGELLLVAFYQQGQAGANFHEVTTIWRSRDGGRTWSERDDRTDVIGREQFLSCVSDGTLFMSAHILPDDTAYPEGPGRFHSYLHRSTNGGHTWERTQVLLEGDARADAPESAGTTTDRNVIELPDGTLLFGVALTSSNVAYMWRSVDKGATWQRDRKCHIRGYYDNEDGFFSNSTTYLEHNGSLLHFVRVGDPSPMTRMQDLRIGAAEGNDNVDRTMLTRSADQGLTWTCLEDFSDYGQMYPRICVLRDGRWLLTFTQRGVTYPFGLRATISYDEGTTWNLHYDQIIIDGFTPWEAASGGGFGNTLQLDDGSLVSCYSYRGSDDQTRVDVVRWSV